MARTEIKIGDTVAIKFPVKLKSFDKFSLRLELVDGPLNIQEITVPRQISALGQFVEGFNWRWRSGIQLEDGAEFSGISNGEYAQVISDTELDNQLADLFGMELSGNIFLGKVVFIYAVYIQKGAAWEFSVNNDLEFFESSTEAQHDFYAYEVHCILQDMGSYVQYPVNLKLLEKI